MQSAHGTVMLNCLNLICNFKNMFLISAATHEFDGSVRYYGQWDGVHKSGVKTSVNFYGTYDFNKDGKVVNGSDFFDVGGLMNAIKEKK